MNPMRAMFVAAQTDPIIGRAFARFFNLLSLPSEMMSDPRVMARDRRSHGRAREVPVPDVGGSDAS